ncbi:MAG: peptidylprolyl isomerase [Marinifilaceae bacterium]
MKYFFVSVLLMTSSFLFGQKNVIDKVIAVIGDEIILKSDIEHAYLREQGEGMISASSNYKAEILEQLLIQKLLVAQAKIDSVSVTEAEVEGAVNERIEYFVNNIGSVERLEQYLNKNIEDFKNELRAPTREKLTTETMQRKIVEKIRVTPSDVKGYYRKLNKDSLPEMPDKYELQQIVIKPEVSEAEKQRVRERLREFREQIISGEKSFNTLAVLFSECGSAAQGGELGYTPKTNWAPEFAEAAFSLKPGKISKIVETEFGFHIIQYIDRKGEKINVRHILLKPKISAEAKEEAIHRLDTVKQLIMDGKATFEEAAYYFSSDKQTKNNGGVMIGANADTKIPRSEIKGEVAKMVNRMKVGDISEPFEDISSSNGQEEMKIIKVKAFYPRHRANLEEDWTDFEMMLRNEKQMGKLEEWIKEKQENTYIHIDQEYRDAKFRYDGWIK